MCFKQKQRKWFGPFLFCALIVFSATSVASDVPATEPQKIVLALYGSRPDLPANIIVDEIIRSTLERELGPRLDFYAEFLDTARWPEGETQSAVHDFLRRRYAHRKLSAIVAVAWPAINFIRLYGDELFPGVPIVVYGDLDALRDWEPGRPITGVLGKVDLSGTVELILRLQPRTREILVISGASPSDQLLQSMARRQLDQLKKRVKLTYVDTGSVGDFVSTVAQVPDGTVILFLSMYEDSAGNRLLSHEVLSRIAKEARVPVYHQGASHVGLGIVGGVVFNPESLGRETAQLTLRVLRGERLQDLPVQESKSSVPMVDWRQLKRWGLDEKRLPAGTIVRFREASVWQSYKWYIIGGISLILVESLLIGGLMWQRARRREANRALENTNRALQERTTESQAREELLKIFVKNVPAGVVMLDRNMRYLQVSDRWCADYGVDASKILGRSHYEAFPDLPEHWKEGHCRALAGETLRADEDRWDRKSGTTWVRWEVRPWKTAEGAVGGILILAEDITRRKQADEVLSGMNRKLIESQEQERTRIGRELHDDINQRLALLAVELDRFDQSGSTKDLQDRVQEFKGRVMEIATDVQALSHQLHSSKLEYLGLAAAAKSYCRELSETHNVRIDFTQNAVTRNLPEDVSICLFRVLQEALQNAVKHSGTDRFEVHLFGTSADIRLTVRDDGRGFNVDEAMKTQGLGLVSMRERVNLVKGTIVIKSKPMMGTEITVHVPVAVADRRSEVTSGAA
jgi:PAS domain S-box-containing protein